MGAGDRSIDPDTSVERALADLHRRLARLEAHLQLAPADGEEALSIERHEPGWVAGLVKRRAERTQQSPPPLPLDPVLTHPASVPPPLPQAMPGLTPEVAPQPAAVLRTVLMATDPPAVPVIPAYAPVGPGPLSPARQNELEQTIGLKWSGWIGAVVVVIGVALGIKYAYDQKWFEILPPAGRLALMSLAAFALIGAGEIVYRRIHVFAAACLYGAGVATLFLVSYAGFGYYRLYEQQTAFILMALSTVAGAAVAMRGNFVSIAVLGQIGGNLAPILLSTDHPRLVPFLSYLLALQIVALALAWWGGSAKWWTLRGLSLATTSLWLIAVFGEGAFAAAVGTKLTFCLIFAAMFQAELILSAIRSSVLGMPSDSEPQPPPLPASAAITPTAKRGVTFSVLVTALLTAALLVVLKDSSDVARGGWVLGLSAACAALGFLLTNDRNDARHHLGVGYRIQAAALLVVAVPVALSGIWIIIGWGILSLAFATLGNLLQLRISRWAGVMVWRLAVLYLGWWTIDPFTFSRRAAAHATWFELLGADVRAYTVVAWILALVGHTVAWLIHQEGLSAVTESDRKFQRLAWVTNGLAGLVWITASVAGLPPAGATFAILAYAWLLLGADLLNPRLGLVLQSGVVVGLAMIKWMAVDTLADRLSPTWSAAARAPVFNAVMGVGLLMSLTMGALYWLRRDVLWGALTGRLWGRSPDGVLVERDGVSPAAPAIALSAVLWLLLSVGLSFEIDRVIEAAGRFASVWSPAQLKMMAWTVLWTITTCAFLALSRRLEPDERLRPAWLRGAEVVLLVIAFKFLLLDTLLFRAMSRPTLAAPGVNFQSFTALVVVSGLVLVAFLMTRGSRGEPNSREEESGGRRGVLFAVAGFLAVLVVLWGGTLEIDRWFEQLIASGSGMFRDTRRAKQVAFSIFWSVFAVSSVVAGFRFRTAGLRYFGLGLFAVTLLKVVLLDMSQVQTGYRVLSFLGLGLLMMGTSVLYGKLSPVLLRDRQTATT